MSEPIISVRNLGKRYYLGGTGSHDTLRDQIAHGVRRLFQSKNQNPQKKDDESFWALKDVSFDVQQGDVVGIIGRNGAGKSTLLKVLSQITDPTEGEVRIRGRVASLLEVGTGFHQELTGRENVFLNGAILGMTKAEIKRKFDEIVDFSGVEKFLDTPVKRYSSGMYVRLAFAVAAHLDPEILVVDEVLAVGDTEFQKKCLGKMESVSRSEGRTVLFVSHNMKSVRTLCHSGIVLESGHLKCRAPIQEALQAYSATTAMQCAADFPVDPSRPSISSVKVDPAQLADGNLVVDIAFKSPFPLNPPVAGLVVSSFLGTPVFGSNPRFHGEGFSRPTLSEGVLRLVANGLPIHGGTYKLSVWLGNWQTNFDEKLDVLAFEFKHGHPAAHTPSPELIGFTDAIAKWSVL